MIKGKTRSSGEILAEIREIREKQVELQYKITAIAVKISGLDKEKNKLIDQDGDLEQKRTDLGWELRYLLEKEILND